MRKTVRLDNLIAGIDLSTPASSIRGNELAWAVNFKPQGGRVRMRGGVKALNKRLTDGTFGFYPTERADNWAALAFGPTNVYWLDAGYNETLIAAIGDGTQAPWSISGWTGGAVFAARPNDGLKVVYLNPDAATDAGLAAPTFTLAGVAAGAGGVIAAGVYSYRAQYRDARTGSKSSYGPVSSDVTVAAGNQVTLTGFVPSTDLKATHIDIFRTFPNGSGAWYLIATIPNSATVYVDNIPVANQGEAASATNGLPPTGILSVVEWRARLWITDGRLLYPSKLLSPQAYNPLDSITVGDTVNDPIVALLDGDNALIIAKRYSMWYLTGTGATSWEVQRFDKQRGAVSTHSVFHYGKTLYWVSDDAVYRSEGLSEGVEVGESSRKLKPVFRSFDTSAPELFTAGAMPDSQGLIFQFYRAAPQPYNLSHILERYFFHIPTQSWWFWQMRIRDGISPEVFSVNNWFRFGRGPTGASVMWSGIDGTICTWDDESKFGDETTIPVIGGPYQTNVPPLRLSPKYLDFERARGLIGQVGIKMRGEPVLGESDTSTAVSGTVLLRTYRERHPGLATPEQAPLQTVITGAVIPALNDLTVNADEGWQRYGLKVVGNPRSSTVGLDIEFSTLEQEILTRPISIEALELELVIDFLPRKIV